MSLFNIFKRKTKKEEAKKIAPTPERVEVPTSKSVGKRIKPSIKQTVQAYQIIQEPHITEKATFLAEQNKYVFKVFSKANKTEIKKAVAVLYGVKVKKVQIVHIAPKKRRLGRHEGWRHGLKRGYKKAIVTLKQGEKIELLPR